MKNIKYNFFHCIYKRLRYTEKWHDITRNGHGFDNKYYLKIEAFTQYRKVVDNTFSQVTL